jgi:hypothetical protein
VEKSCKESVELPAEKGEQKCSVVWRYPPESTPSTELFRRRYLTRLVLEDDDACVVLLFVRLRSLLFELCPDHPVAFCGACRRTYTPEQLGTAIGNGCHLCRQCGADLTESLVAHARTCRNLAPQKPLERMTSISGSTTPSAASARFAARRRIRLGPDAHAAAG